MKIKKLAVVFFSALIVCVCSVGNVNAIECPHASLAEASDYLLTSDEVEVSTVEVDSWDGTTPAETDDNIYYSFTPKDSAPVTAFIILPGGNSDPKAYAPLAYRIAAEGFLVIILPVPDCVAMPFGQLRAEKIISDFEEIEKWAIGGHSVGGTAACLYAKRDAVIDGVIIWASIPPNILVNTNLKVITIYGSEDGRNPPDQVVLFAKLLPADAIYVEIEGGNHTQFAYYDTSPDPYLEEDNAATITLEEQQEIIANHTSDFLSDLSKRVIGAMPDSVCPAAKLLGEDNPQLDTIRQFRDKVLEKNPLGRKLIDLYYKNGDIVISILDRHPMIQKSTRNLLESLVPAMEQILK